MSSPATSNPPPATTAPLLSVVIPACNPGMRHFRIVLEALRSQMLAKDRWELIVVDDASKVPLRLEVAVESSKVEKWESGREDGGRQFAVGSWREGDGNGRADGGTGGETGNADRLKSGNAEMGCGLLVSSSEWGKEQGIGPTKKEALIDLSWHPNARLVETDPEREGLGLVSARLRGFELGKGDVFVFVDQDNALRPDYLQGVADIAAEYPHLGTWGGQILLKFDEPDKAPADWLKPMLCTRTLTGDLWSNDPKHHDSTPWGAGLCVRRSVMELYRAEVLRHPLRRLLDPTPRRAGFGGDSDVSYVGCRHGFGKGAFARLVLDHLTPVGRCSDDYMVRMSKAKGYSEGIHHYVESGKAYQPRRDWRYFFGRHLKRIGQPALRARMEEAWRAGQLEAQSELEENLGELEAYAQKLAEKAAALPRRVA